MQDIFGGDGLLCLLFTAVLFNKNINTCMVCNLMHVSEVISRCTFSF